MEAFHNDQSVKDKYLNRVLAHKKADEIIKGQYWKDGKGCAVGCTIHSVDHSLYEIELGIPKWLAHLEDTIFENLPNNKAIKWPIKFLKSINVGCNLQKIFIPMLIFIVESAHKKTDDIKVLSIIDRVLLELKKDKLDLDKLNEARAAAATYASVDTAYAYATATAAAANSAAYAADAAYDADAIANASIHVAIAADAAATAASAADATNAYDTYNTRAAAASAARKNEYVKFADKLLELIKRC